MSPVTNRPGLDRERGRIRIFPGNTNKSPQGLSSRRSTMKGGVLKWNKLGGQVVINCE